MASGNNTKDKISWLNLREQDGIFKERDKYSNRNIIQISYMLNTDAEDESILDIGEGKDNSTPSDSVMKNPPSRGFPLEHDSTTKIRSNLWLWLYKKQTSACEDLAREERKHAGDLQIFSSDTEYGVGTEHGQKA